MASNFRSVLPFAAGYIGLVIIVARVWRRESPGFSFFSPLALITVYGLVGTVASLKSPDGQIAIYWSSIYLAVPIALWAAVWGPHSIDHLRRLVNVTWVVIILFAAALFTMAVLKLDLAGLLTDPSRLLECKAAGWFDFTSGRLRETGVGRYAAIAALVAFSGLWQRNWRYLWIVVFLASSLLLLSTGARGSFLGFAAGMTVILVAHRSKRTFAFGLVALGVIVSLFWVTGTFQTFLDKCIFVLMFK
jgi:hypothetical protein